MSGIYDQSCDEWDTTFDQFLAQKDWPDYRDEWGWPSSMLRSFWGEHGCVRCWFRVHMDFKKHLPEYDHDEEKVWVANPLQSTRWLEVKIENWNNPRSRQRDHFYCVECSKKLKCIAAVKWASHLKDVAGHMGWGYEVPSIWLEFTNGSFGPWRFGEKAISSLENRPKIPFTNVKVPFIPLWGFHEENGSNPVDALSAVFDEYKLLRVDDGNFEEAYLRALEVADRPYLLFINNCNHSVGYILNGFGAKELPEYYIPGDANYYGSIRAPARMLPTASDNTLDPLDAPPGDLPQPVGAAASHLSERHRAAHEAAVAEQLRAFPARTHRQKRRSRLADGMMPVLDYWVNDSRSARTIHFVDECPARPDFECEVLEEPEHPLDIADRLSAHPCGTCLKMLESSAKEGFLFGKVTKENSLALYRDRVEFASMNWLGNWGPPLVVPSGELDSVEFQSQTRLIIASSQGQIDFTFGSAGEAAIAREAFSRLGFSF